MYGISLVKLKHNVYQPEPWARRELLFHAGETVPVVEASNLPDDSPIKYWIDLPDPRTGRDNAYGFGLGTDDII